MFIVKEAIGSDGYYGTIETAVAVAHTRAAAEAEVTRLAAETRQKLTTELRQEYGAEYENYPAIWGGPAAAPQFIEKQATAYFYEEIREVRG